MATSNDELARWAASFLTLYSEIEPIIDPLVDPREKPLVAHDFADASRANLTSSARDLLRAVDAGGVPAFMTGAIKQIALDNGITVTTNNTPNDVIDALRARCMTSATTQTTNFE